MNSYIAVALVALAAMAIKTLVLIKVVTRTNLNSAFVVLALSLIAMNASEFMGLIVLAVNPDAFKPYLYAVFLTLILFPIAMLRLVALVTQNKLGALVLNLATLYSAILCALLLSGNLIGGYEVLSYTAISIPGAYYNAFKYYGLFILSAPLTMLLIGARSNNLNIARRSKITLIAIMPICIVGLGVIALRFVGFNASTAFGMSLATTAFLWVLMLDGKNEFVTLQIKWRVLWKLSRQLQDLNLSRWIDAIEKEIIEETLLSQKFNISEAARTNNMNRSTYHRKMAKYGIADCSK